MALNFRRSSARAAGSVHAAASATTAAKVLTRSCCDMVSPDGSVVGGEGVAIGALCRRCLRTFPRSEMSGETSTRSSTWRCSIVEEPALREGGAPAVGGGDLVGRCAHRGADTLEVRAAHALRRPDERDGAEGVAV